VTERPKSSHEPASAKEPIVFVIDDDLAMRATLSSLFRSVGLRVELFGSAREFAQIKMPDVCKLHRPRYQATGGPDDPLLRSEPRDFSCGRLVLMQARIIDGNGRLGCKPRDDSFGPVGKDMRVRVPEEKAT
jgi:hypothetical protein